jgi:hypothetical protein
MGQLITVSHRDGVRPEVKHFALNRSLTGMQTLRYRAGEEITGDKPPDELARRLFAIGNVDSVTIYSSVVTVSAPAWNWDDIVDKVTETIANLFIYYGEGVTPAPAAVPETTP